MERRLRTVSRVCAGGAAVLALAASLYLAFAPVYGVEASAVTTVTSLASGQGAAAPGPAATTPRRLADVSGARVYAILLVPVLLAGLPFVRRWVRPALGAVASAVCLWGFVVVSGFSIGQLYVPAAWVAAFGAAAAVLGATAGRAVTRQEGGPPHP